MEQQQSSSKTLLSKQSCSHFSYLPFRLLSVGRRIANNRWLPKFSPRPFFETAAAAVAAAAAAAAAVSADDEYDKRHFFDEWMRGRFL